MPGIAYYTTGLCKQEASKEPFCEQAKSEEIRPMEKQNNATKSHNKTRGNGNKQDGTV